MLKKLMGERVLSGVTAADEEIAAYYEENRAYYKRPRAVDISQILVETEEEAGELLKRAGVKKSQFEELAREHSIGPEAVDGGHLGVFQRGELPVSFETEVFGLRKGKVSKVVHTDFGYHIFRVNEVYPARDLSLKEVEETIRVELLRKKSDEAMKIYLEGLRERYPVIIDMEQLDFPYMDRSAISRQLSAVKEQH